MGGCHVERLEDNPRDSLGEGVSLLDAGVLVDDHRVDVGKRRRMARGDPENDTGFVLRVRVASCAFLEMGDAATVSASSTSRRTFMR